MSKWLDKREAEKIAKFHSEVRLKLDVLERLLMDRTTILPPTCNCAIKSRAVEHHLPSCFYRNLKEVIQILREQVGP